MKTADFKTADFRKELEKIMPGYEWTVHQTSKTAVCLTATGKQSSGFNRLSTLSVVRWAREGEDVVYEVKSAPNGTRSPWAHVAKDGTLARALRGLQTHYENQAQHFAGLAGALQIGRKAPEAEPAGKQPA